MSEKLVIMDTIKESILVFSAPTLETIEEFLNYLDESNVISGLNTIHWHVMKDLSIKNYTK
jgi:hypothetical protein